MNKLYGDSYSSIPCFAPSVQSNGYVELLAAQGISFENHAIAGGMAADMSVLAYGNSLSSNDIALLQIFANEQHVYQSDATKQGYARAFLTSILTQCAAPNRTKAINMTYATGAPNGSWVNWAASPTWLSGGMESWLQGATISGSFKGSSLYVSIILSEPSAVLGNTLVGTADVIVDGVKVGSVCSNGTGMLTGQGANQAPATYRFGNIPMASDGTDNHTCSIVMTSNIQSIPGLVRILDIAGSNQSVKPLVVVGNIPKWTAAAYTSIGGSDAIVAQYCAITADVISKLQSDGLNVRLVDNFSTLTTDDMADLHPNDAGHAQMAANFSTGLGSITPPPPPPPTYVPAYLFTDGTDYFGAKDAAGTLNLKQVS